MFDPAQQYAASLEADVNNILTILSTQRKAGTPEEEAFVAKHIAYALCVRARVYHNGAAAAFPAFNVRGKGGRIAYVFRHWPRFKAEKAFGLYQSVCPRKGEKHGRIWCVKALQYVRGLAYKLRLLGQRRAFMDI